MPVNTEQSKAIVYLIGGLVAVVLIIILFKKFLGIPNAIGQGLGLSNTPAGQANQDFLDSYVQSELKKGTASMWSPKYVSDAYALSLSDTEKNTIAGAANLFWDSVGIFWDSPLQGEAAIKQLSRKTQLGVTAKIMSQEYGIDLLTWLYNKYDINSQRQSLVNIVKYAQTLA